MRESKFATGSFSSGLSSCSAWVGWRGSISISPRTMPFIWASRAVSCSAASWGFSCVGCLARRGGNNNDARIVRQPAAEPASPGEHGDRRRPRSDGGVLVRLVRSPRALQLDEPPDCRGGMLPRSRQLSHRRLRDIDCHRALPAGEAMAPSTDGCPAQTGRTVYGRRLETRRCGSRLRHPWQTLVLAGQTSRSSVHPCSTGQPLPVLSLLPVNTV